MGPYVQVIDRDGLRHHAVYVKTGTVLAKWKAKCNPERLVTALHVRHTRDGINCLACLAQDGAS